MPKINTEIINSAINTAKTLTLPLNLHKFTGEVFSDNAVDAVAGLVGTGLEAEELQGFEIGEVLVGTVVPILFMRSVRWRQEGSSVYAQN